MFKRKKPTVEFHPHHSQEAFDYAVERCMNMLKPMRQHFDFIAVQGASGLTVGSVVAYMLHKKLLVVRKPKEDVHSFPVISAGAESTDPNRTVFLDDFLSTGATYQRVIKALKGRPAFVCLYFTKNQMMLYTAARFGLQRHPQHPDLFVNGPTSDPEFQWREHTPSACA